MSVSMKKEVIFDLDDVLCHLNEGLEQAFLKETGIFIPSEQWHTYNCFDLFGLNYEEFINMMNKHQLIKDPRPDETAIQVLNELKQEGHNIHIITSRANQNNAENFTYQWLKKHGVNYDTLSLTGVEKTKNDVIEEIGGAFAMIDDFQGNLVSAEKTGLIQNLVLRVKPWNHCSRDKFHTVNCVSEFKTIFNEG
jgi:uncharacterized HAD superfamily protein